MKNLLHISKQLKSVFGLTIILSLTSVLSSCNKNKPKSAVWYIYESYAKYSPTSAPIPLSPTGLDHKLDFKNDGTIYYFIESVPSAAPAYWGSYTNTTITLGSGGSGSTTFQITNQDSHIIEASYATPNTTLVQYLTLKR